MNQSIDYFSLWRDMVTHIPDWELTIGIIIIAFGLMFLFFLDGTWMQRLGIFHAFEKMRMKKKDIDKAFRDMTYIEITIPKDSQATAFQIQQKIFKSLHSVYLDSIEGQHNFSKTFYLFQKMYRFWKVSRSPRTFFTFQIFAQYPYISFRLNIPTYCFHRIEKAIFNAYPNAEIMMVDKEAITKELSKFHKNYLAYGQSTIEGQFWQRIKTFKDFSSDPIDSIISTMEGLGRGRFMVYNVFLSPTSHFFNQIIHFLVQDEEQRRQALFIKQEKTEVSERDQITDLVSSLKMAMLEKMKASLFQIIVSYWTVSDTPEDANARLENIQAVLTELNQKNMNSLMHKRLFTRQIEEMQKGDELKDIVDMRPVFERRKFKFFTTYENNGQIIFDNELYSFWHLPNTDEQTVSSIKMTKYKKLPASQHMREFAEDFFIRLGSSNFRMQEDAPVGIPTWDDMKKHVYILGGTGAGKSETLKTILGNILQKEGDEKTACLIIDPKNDFATDLLTMIPESRKDDVIYFNPSMQKERPLSFPFFAQFSGEKSNDERIEFLISIMKRFVQLDSEFSWGPELENILRQIFATAYIFPEQSLSGLDVLLHDPKHITNIAKYVPSRLRNFWTGSILNRSNNDLAKYLATTNNKLGKFLDYPEFMNIADRMDAKITFEEMIKTGKIFIANFGSSSEQMKKYYSVYLAAHIAEAIFGQARIPSENRKPTVFVVDEFQRVASDIFETLFSEVRAFNTALVISNQFMGQLSERIQKSIESNIATKIFMRTQSITDAEIAEKILDTKVMSQDIINLPVGTAYLKTLVHGVPQEAMSIKIQRTAHPTDIAKDTEEFFIKQTMEQYGTPLDVIAQKRDMVNNTYYSSKNAQIFSEHMDRHKTYKEAIKTREVSSFQDTFQAAKTAQSIFDF